MTDVGKILRIIRINCNDTAKDMADKLQMSSAYLSAIENGNRNVPQDFYESVCKVYELNIVDQNKLKKAITSGMGKVQIDMTEFSEQKKEMLLTLSKNDIDEVTMEKLCQIIKLDKKQ